MDENGDGKITVSELRESLRIQGMEMVEEDAEKLLHVIDVKGRNTLDYTEFIAATMQRRQFVEVGGLHGDGCNSLLQATITNHFSFVYAGGAYESSIFLF